LQVAHSVILPSASSSATWPVPSQSVQERFPAPPHLAHEHWPFPLQAGQGDMVFSSFFWLMVHSIKRTYLRNDLIMQATF
jgi:hypothetical protein